VSSDQDLSFEDSKTSIYISCNQVRRVSNRQLSNCFCKNKHQRLLTLLIISWKIIYQD